MEVQYTAEAVSSGGREGRVRSADGVIDLPLSLPKELGGAGRPGTTNPEALFAAGYAACFENAMLRAPRERKLRVTGSSVTARAARGDLPLLAGHARQHRGRRRRHLSRRAQRGGAA